MHGCYNNGQFLLKIKSESVCSDQVCDWYLNCEYIQYIVYESLIYIACIPAARILYIQVRNVACICTISQAKASFKGGQTSDGMWLLGGGFHNPQGL